MKFETLSARRLRITIPGDPIPKARARTFMRGSRIAHYDPQDREKRSIATQLSIASGSALIDCGWYHPHNAYRVDITFHVPYPHATSQRAATLQMWGLGTHPQKPDIDNMTKFYFDCMNSVIWPDDCQITFLRAEKIYCENPKTIINITCMENTKIDIDIENILAAFTPDDYVQFLRSCAQIIEIDRTAGVDSMENVYKMRAENVASFAQKHAPMLHKIFNKCKKLEK